MTRKELRNTLPQTPDHFVSRMDETLKEIERMNISTKTTRHTYRTVLIAAVLILALTGTAVAIGSALGVFDHIKRTAVHIDPLDGAEELLSTNLASTESPLGRVEICEALYTDTSCKITVDIAPAEGVTFMFPDLTASNADMNVLGLSEVWNSDGSASYMIEAMITGAQPELLECEVSVPFYKNSNAPEAMITGMQPEQLEGEVSVPFHQNSNAPETIALPFTLTHTAGSSTALIPQGEGERWSIVEANISRNDFSMTFDVRYRYNPLPSEDMGVDIIAFDAQGNRITSGDSSFTTEAQSDGTILYRQITEIQSAETLPDMLILKPKVIGEDRWLDPIECAIE